MNRSIIIPDLTWYSARSKEEGGSPRCPFASEELCPRYYESRLLLGEVGVTTEVSPEDRARLNRKWKALNPTTAEQAANVSSRGDGLHCVSNFCPEVSYEIYGFFARYLGPYSDELDRDAVHEFLSKRRVRVSDPRWQWKSISPCHYTECREFSILGSPVARFHLEMEGGDGVPATVEHSAKTTTRRVFLVHGHDDEARYSVARFLEQLDLAGRCKTPRNRANRAPRYLIFHDFIPGIGFPIPF